MQRRCLRLKSRGIECDSLQVRHHLFLVDITCLLLIQQLEALLQFCLGWFLVQLFCEFGFQECRRLTMRESAISIPIELLPDLIDLVFVDVHLSLHLLSEYLHLDVSVRAWTRSEFNLIGQTLCFVVFALADGSHIQ